MGEAGHRETGLRREFLGSCALLLSGVVLGFITRTTGWTSGDLAAGAMVQSVRTAWLTSVAQALNASFRMVPGLLMTGILVGTLFVSGRRRAARLVLTVVTAGWIVSPVTKALVARPRPPAYLALVQKVDPGSFPSGHVCLTLSIVVAVVMACRHVWTGTGYLVVGCVVAGCVLVLAQMLARVYLGVHHPTDTLGSLLLSGGAIGLALSVRRPQP
ncbi:phosphatase PAP2 family protein [Nonomuraea endophytica]|uniref:Undecaprenyl-diphosphatase n=1 Tax=Nonomuraea endophytica TaxID=714136 RepID=A0A7W8AB55_9ACTN|nr:phosphatase PAP2 family protein [Nonomuraea endophytica]MBB5081936.1 undecaprenyl-diphosphatase [Nonomuraea endophytica]